VTDAPLDPLTELAALSVRTAVLLDVQLTVRPTSVAPLASFGVAVRTWVPATIIAVTGAESVTLDTGTALTVIELLPVCPSLVAVIVTGPPALTAVTSPAPSTVATETLADDHPIVRPVRIFPAASRVTAASCRVPPTTMLAEPGVTVTVATRTGLTVITGVVAAGADSLVAVIVAVP
jgi:hypothetical protein